MTAGTTAMNETAASKVSICFSIFRSFSIRTAMYAALNFSRQTAGIELLAMQRRKGVGPTSLHFGFSQRHGCNCPRRATVDVSLMKFDLSSAR
jgi:hypothetical protein